VSVRLEGYWPREPSSLCGLADMMHEARHKFSRKAVYDHLSKLTETDYEMDDVTFQWRKARAAFEYATADAAAPKKELLLEALKILKRCSMLQRSNAEIHRWHGRVVMALREFQTEKESLQSLFEAHDEFQQAVEVEPSDAVAFNLIGQWCLEVASWSWYYRMYLAWNVAEPPVGTFADARDSFARAERIAPGQWKMNQLMLM
jgi:tetratricopeptide (TPR) repeat protein